MLIYKRLSVNDLPIAKKLVAIFRNQVPEDEKVLLALADPFIYIYVALLDDDVCGYLKAYRLKRIDCEMIFLSSITFSFRRSTSEDILPPS